MDGLRSANPPSAAVLGERRYPVVFAEPTLPQVFANFSRVEQARVAGAAALGAPLGYYLGWRYHLRRPSAWFGVFALGTGAVAHAMQQSCARLMGVLPNDAEVGAHLETRPGK